jgi:TPR repeat protein/serine/threonine protein kinase
MPPAAARCPNCFADGPGDPCRHCGWRAGNPTPAPYLPVGTLFDGRYRIGRVLGHGGFGITYLGWDENLDLKLAIKEYLPRDLGARSGPGATVSVYTGEAQRWFQYGLERFQDEARTLAKFQQHPGIISVYNFFRANGTGYMVMEYVEGFTLKSYLDKKGLLPYRTARRALLPVMDALRAVHAEGLLHRDVSPDNIYINQQKQVKLLDFGAARFAASEHSRSLSVVLKPGFAPVEQYSSKGKQGPWTDVYALAATFYHCITGETPPDAMDRLEEDGLRRPSQLGVEIPLVAEQMLLAGLAVRAKDRPQSMETFQRVFLQEGATTEARQAPRPAPADPAPDWTAPPVTQTQPPADKPSRPAPGRPANWPTRSRKPGPSLGVYLGAFLGLALVVLIIALSLPRGGQREAAVAYAPPAPSTVPAAETNEPSDPRAQFDLGLKYFNGDGVTQSDTEALRWWRLAAEQGDAWAQSHLGLMYVEGRGVGQSDTEAVRWLSLAAQQGDTKARSNLGSMYVEGRGVPQSDTEAVRWWSLAADEGGDASAQLALGLMYATGRGVLQSDTDAVRWFRRSAEHGNSDALFYLGFMYAQGRGVAQSDSQAVIWYREAAEQGHAAAPANLGLMYIEGRGVAQSVTEAARWLSLAAERGHAEAQFSLGLMYAEGWGVGQSDTEAVKWYRSAAEQGEAQAQTNLGVMYANGRGVAQSDAEAVQWFRMAADQGDSAGQARLGMMYALGLGVGRDEGQALHWLELAAAQGNSEAQVFLDEMRNSTADPSKPGSPVAPAETAVNLEEAGRRADAAWAEARDRRARQMQEYLTRSGQGSSSVTEQPSSMPRRFHSSNPGGRPLPAR